MTNTVDATPGIVIAKWFNHFTIINFDGVNVGIRDEFCDIWLEFDSLEEAINIARHWDAWIDTGES